MKAATAYQKSVSSIDDPYPYCSTPFSTKYKRTASVVGRQVNLTVIFCSIKYPSPPITEDDLFTIPELSYKGGIFGQFLHNTSSQIVDEGSDSCPNDIVVDESRSIILLDIVCNEVKAYSECGMSDTTTGFFSCNIAPLPPPTSPPSQDNPPN